MLRGGAGDDVLKGGSGNDNYLEEAETMCLKEAKESVLEAEPEMMYSREGRVAMYSRWIRR